MKANVHIAIALISLAAICGCNRTDDRSTKVNENASSGEKLVAMLVDIDSLRITPEEIGTGWKYSRGHKNANNGHGRNVRELYATETLGNFIDLQIARSELLRDAKTNFKSRISVYKSQQYAGLGEDARIEVRGSQRKPRTEIAFLRSNVIVTLSQPGRDSKVLLHVAKQIDTKIKNNLKMVVPPKSMFDKKGIRPSTPSQRRKAREKIGASP